MTTPTVESKINDLLRTVVDQDLGDDTKRTSPIAPVLCVDDDPAVLALCKAALTRAGFAVETVTSGWEALKRLNERDYSVILLDLLMPSLHGHTVLSMMQQSHPQFLPRIVVMTGLTDGAIGDLYGKVGGILRKPLKIDSLVEFVREFSGHRIHTA